MGLRDYLKRNYNLWIIVFLLGLVSHGSMLLSKSIGIDTEDIITLQDLFYGGWLETGRQGLVLLKIIFGTQVFNPYFSGAATLVFMTLACVLWTYLFSYISGKEHKVANMSFSAILLFSPLITEQFYFKLQSMEITLGFCLMAVSLLLLYQMIEVNKYRSKVLCFIGAILLNVLLFSLYQVMVPLFIFGAGVCFGLHYFFSTKENEDWKDFGRFIGIYILVFLVSFVANQIITSAFFSGSDYLTSQIRWFSQSFKDCLINIYWHVRDVMLGKSLYYAKTFILYCVLFIVLGVLNILGSKNKKAKILGVFSILLILSSPFYMTLICGNAPVVRSQLVLPFTLAFLVYVLFLFVRDKRNVTIALLALCILTGYTQLRYTMQLNYTDSVRYESDVRIASSIMEEINQLENETYSYPVVFIGKHSAELNNSCIKGDTIGYSFFEWDTDVEPYSFFSTRRILGFMHTLGGNYIQGNVEQFTMAREHSKSMNNWPMQGSIELHDGVVIVKLSD